MIRSPAGFDGGDRIKRYLDYYQPSYGVMMLSAGQFSPLSLFAAGEQGAWYDPSDFSTMYQNAAGTTPVTAVEQPVGLLLDKSKGLALGSELVTNGDFSNGTTGWTIASTGTAVVTSGIIRITSVSGRGTASQTLPTVVGQQYRLDLGLISNGNAGASAAIVRITSNNSYSGTVIAAVGSASSNGLLFFTATTTSTYIWLAENTATASNYVEFGGLSVRSDSGNHATQSTAASRPVLSARVNLLTYSEQFDNAAWTKQNGAISANAETAPNGTLTADKFTPTAAASVDHRVITGVITTTGGYTLALYVKPAGYSKFGFRNGAVGEHATFNLSGAGAVIEVNDCTATITAEPDGWYKVQIVDTSASIRCDMWPLDDGYTSGNPGAYSYTGDGTSGIYLWGADLRVTNVGVGLPAYQRVAAATDYDTSGFPLYLKFDGVDDSLATGTIDPGAVDKAQVFAGVRKLSDAAVGVLYELSANINLNNGVFYSAPGYAGVGSIVGGYWQSYSKGTVPDNAATANLYPAPATAVQSQICDIAGDVQKLRINGAELVNSTDDQGTGNFLSYPLYIGRRNNASSPFNGNLYSMILRFSAANLSDAQIASTETYVNNLTKAY